MTSALDQELRAAGLRVTQGRLAVLALLEHHPHSDADTVHRLLAAEELEVPLQSVHNILGDLTSAHLLRRIEPARSPARYERRVDDNHHHVVCRSCGAIADVDCVVGEAPCLHAHTPDVEGYAIDTAEITFWGLCPACRSNAIPDEPPHTPLTAGRSHFSL